MATGTPSLRRIVTMVLFALSCVGLLLFLWLSFGGPIPFNPQGYRVRISFANAGQLGSEADVRIAGVSVGKVVDKTLDRSTGRTVATIQMGNKFAPIHRDSRAILREKTIIGETYVELTPGTPGSPALADGGMLPQAQVEPAVQLDQVFNTFDPQTRLAFQDWQQSLATTFHGNAQNLNSVLGNLPTFAADASDLLRVLDVEHSAVVRLVQNGGTVFASLSHSQSSLRNLITSSDQTFATTAANNNALAASFHVFPTFLTESKLTFASLKSFSLNTDPVIKELEPVAQALGPTLHSVAVLSPDLLRLFTNLGPLIDVSKTGLPAIRDVVHGTQPLLGAIGPFLEQLNPILGWLSIHQQLISDFISQGGAAVGAKGDTTPYGGSGGLTCQGVPCGHYLRQYTAVGGPSPGFLNKGAAQLKNVRGNAYPPPLWLADPNVFSANGQVGQWALPSWNCINAGGPKPVTMFSGTPPVGSNQACRVAPPLPGATPGKIPRIRQASYSSK